MHARAEPGPRRVHGHRLVRSDGYPQSPLSRSRHNGDLDAYMRYYKERYRSEHHLARYDEDTIDRLNLAA